MRDASNDTLLFATLGWEKKKFICMDFFSGRAVSLHKTSGESSRKTVRSLQMHACSPMDNSSFVEDRKISNMSTDM